MPGKNFLLLSLEDAKIKKVSNVISNESCRKILDYLAAKNATESELAEKLNLPISTVHYNLQQLMETGLISAEEFHYSAKGREVNHYRLANKYIIIAPKKAYGIREKLKSILPVALITAGTAGMIQLAAKYFSKPTAFSTAVAKESIAAAPTALRQTSQIAPQTNYFLPQNIALWFLAGALFALLVYFVLGLTKKNKD